MLKFIKHNLETIDGVDIYPIISLSIFFVIFVSFFIWAINRKYSMYSNIALWSCYRFSKIRDKINIKDNKKFDGNQGEQ